MSEPPNPFADLPEQDADPVEWDARQRRFVEGSERRAHADTVAAPQPEATRTRAPAANPARDERRFFVGADAVGQAPPPRLGGTGSPPIAPPPLPPPGVPAHPLPVPEPRPKPEPTPSKRGWWPPRRPRPRWILLACALLPVILVGAGLLYADMKFREIKRVPVGSLLDSGGSGTNILIVGSDTRAAAEQNAADGGATAGSGNIEVPGQRSDTIMVLRLESGGAKMLSIPRDLIVTTAETGQKTRINASYNVDLGGGPGRLIKTVQQSLGLRINRYMEVDFVTFAGLVDAVGGVDIDFPYPASDSQSGLDVKQTGSVKLNGDQALAYVRSRHYTEIKEDGKPHEDPTADLGREGRQQDFMRAVMSKIASSKNPVTLLQVGGKVASGIRIDDALGFWGALRLAWDLKGVSPKSVELPVAVNNDGATLHLQQPEANGVLSQFK